MTKTTGHCGCGSVRYSVAAKSPSCIVNGVLPSAAPISAAHAGPPNQGLPIVDSGRPVRAELICGPCLRTVEGGPVAACLFQPR